MRADAYKADIGMRVRVRVRGREFCDRAFFRYGVVSFVTDPFCGTGWRVL